MGIIQNSINGGLGTLAGAATMAKHISNQNKELQLKQAGAELDMVKAHNAQMDAENDVLADMMSTDPAKVTKLQKTMPNSEIVNQELKSQVNEYDKYIGEAMDKLDASKDNAERANLSADIDRYYRARQAVVAKQDAIKYSKAQFDIARKQFQIAGGDFKKFMEGKE